MSHIPTPTAGNRSNNHDSNALFMSHIHEENEELDLNSPPLPPAPPSPARNTAATTSVSQHTQGSLSPVHAPSAIAQAGRHRKNTLSNLSNFSSDSNAPHRRVVSFDINKQVDKIVEEIQIDLPVDITSADDRAQAGLDALEKHKLQKRVGLQGVGLQDVIDSTIELEAETYLLKVLEEKEPIIPNRSRSNTGTSHASDTHNILENVPDNVAHNFAGTSEMSARVAVPLPTTTEEAASASGASQMKGGNAGRRQHRRTPTVEQTIFGLTTALDAIGGGGESKINEESESEGEVLENEGERLGKMANMLLMKSTHHLLEKVKEVEDEAGTLETANGETAPDLVDGALNVDVTNQAPSTARWNNILRSRFRLRKSPKGGSGNTMKRKSGWLRVSKADGADVNGDIEQGGHGSDDGKDGSGGGAGGNKKKRRVNPFVHLPYGEIIKDEWDRIDKFLRPRRSVAYLWTKVICFYLVGPLVGIAAILYYLAGNPPYIDPASPEAANRASASYWLMFIARNIITFALSKITEVFIIEYLCLQTQLFVRFLGPYVTLLIVQSKGWPFLASFWGVYSGILIAGPDEYCKHWFFWQDTIGLLNGTNPAGNVTNTLWYTKLVTASSIVGAVVAAKRLAIGLHLGRKTFSQFSDSLAKVMNKMLLVSEVAALAKEIEYKSWQKTKILSIPIQMRGIKGDPTTIQMPSENLGDIIAKEYDEEEKSESDESLNNDDGDKMEEPDGEQIFEKIVDTNSGDFSLSQKARISQLLGDWEEPPKEGSSTDRIPIAAVLQFRKALAHMETDFPFTPAFGNAETREMCVASAQDVFLRLLLKTPESNGILPFETMATVARVRKGQLDDEKIKDLIRVFRPERDGSLSLLDFVRSVDAVYKELRLLRATVASSTRMDTAIENIFNIVFYVIVGSVILTFYGIDPMSIFLSFSSVILAFVFMIGGAAARYFDGLLFILVQRPYSIGDRINVSNSESLASNDGAQGWIVEDVSLYKTSVVLASTNERATISNGILAKSRIINGARSNKAILSFTLKFGFDVPYEKIEIFKSAVEKFVKARPREWLSLLGFRATRVEADLGFIEYIVVLNHRDRWQNMSILLSSKATLQSFCLELQNKLNMRYQSPSLPVDIRMKGGLMAPQPTPNDVPASVVPGGSAIDNLSNAHEHERKNTADRLEDDLDLVHAIFTRK